ncbi:MAG: hypothetical protein H7Z71_06385 [Moraxellaceae bacterium]|nr:hypothetical protein [Pseudobdellovibrionaceae bacterium]
MIKYLLLFFTGFSTICHANQSQPIDVRERGLIAVINLAAGRGQPRSLKTKMYVAEEIQAFRLIEQKSRDHYGKVIFLFREETNEVNFLKTLETMALDPEIKTIDMILYAHGHNADPKYAEGAPALGLYNPQGHFTRSDLLGPEVKAVARGKLRMLYLESCWGTTQSQDWLNAGFLSVAGSKLVDGNHAIDLKRFLKKWLYGETFGNSINFGNKNIFGKVLDRMVKGDSTKVPLGALDLTIDQTYFD